MSEWGALIGAIGLVLITLAIKYGGQRNGGDG